MQQHELGALFDRQAAGYDTQWVRMAPIRCSRTCRWTRGCCAWTPKRFPRWRFLALDPAPEMIAKCRERADVAILPPDKVATRVADAGFDAPLRLHQAGMIHGWSARRR